MCSSYAMACRGHSVREWLDPDKWKRDGSGRHWEFVLPTPAIVEALQDVASKREDTLELLACFRLRDGRTWFSLYEPQRVQRLSADGPWQYFVRSLTLSPVIPAPARLSGTGWPAVFAANGLVLLHHPDAGRAGDHGQSSIGVVNRVRHTQTEEVREHAEYDELFRALKRALHTLSKRASG